MNTSKSKPLQFTLSGRDLIFSSASGKISGNVTVFSGIGKQLFSVDFTDLMPLTQRFTLPSFTPGLNILHVTVNNTTYTCSFVEMGSNLYMKESVRAVGENFRLAKSMADSIVDTLIA